ncbi:helix-turn-helix transcriptional regulator [Rhodococcus sp. NPDC060084]|uniref:helix-turn-helix transcriptional regulator n=1 Tax=Rhodococcus sp. NPDC060084 TaxID=3347053 RepID=UPI003665F144
MTNTRTMSSKKRDGVTNASTDHRSKELLTTREVSETYCIPVATLRYWRCQDLGPESFAIGRRVLYRREALEQWLSEQEAATKRGGRNSLAAPAPRNASGAA